MNTILEKRLKQVDSDVWGTYVLSEIFSFCSDPNVAIQKGDDTLKRVNIIDKPVITTK